jgi:hypothetical protein
MFKRIITRGVLLAVVMICANVASAVTITYEIFTDPVGGAADTIAFTVNNDTTDDTLWGFAVGNNAAVSGPPVSPPTGWDGLLINSTPDLLVYETDRGITGELTDKGYNKAITFEVIDPATYLISGIGAGESLNFIGYSTPGAWLPSDFVAFGGNPEDINTFNIYTGQTSLVPIPAAAWLFASALGAFGYLGKRKTKA